MKDLELVYFSGSTRTESIDELTMMAMKGGDLDEADRAAIGRIRSMPPVEAKIPEQSRFVVRAKVGYDNGAGSRDQGVIGESNDLEEARAIRDKYGAEKAIGNTQAAYDYAEIEDRQGEHAVAAHGKYRDGTPITFIRPVISLCKTDEVLFRGTLRECQMTVDRMVIDNLNPRLIPDFTTEVASRVEYIALHSELERIERDIALGRDTPEGDARLKEIDRIMDESPWTLHPDRGCVRKESAKQLEWAGEPDGPDDEQPAERPGCN